MPPFQRTVLSDRALLAFGSVLVLALTGCSLDGHVQRYDFACDQGSGGTVPGLQVSLLGLLPDYRYADFLDECEDGGGRALIYEREPEGTLDRSSVTRGGCELVHNPDAVDEDQFKCVLSGAAVELTVEDNRIYAVPLRA